MFQSPALRKAISERRKARKLSFHSPATFRAAADREAKAKQRITLTLTATQKTLALGLPLLRVVFAGRPDLGVLCTPLLIQHPLQLFVGSVLSPKLKAVAEAEED